MTNGCTQKEEEIYQGLKENLDWALKCLYLNYYQSSVVPVRRYKGDKQDGEDAFQDALLIFIQKIKSNRFEYQEGKMGSYLQSIVKGLWLNELRKKKWSTQSEELLKEIAVDGDEDIYQIFEKEERGKLYDDVIALLEERCKDIITGRYILELPEKQLAEKWKFGSTTALQVARNRCLGNLRKRLDIQS